MSSPNQPVTFEEISEVTVDYRFVEDVESELLEEGEVRSDEPDEPGWEFTASERLVVRSRGAELNASEWDEVMAGLVPAPLVNTVAVVIELLREHLPEAVAAATHTIDGSAEEFERQFGGAFDLAVGAPDLA